MKMNLLLNKEWTLFLDRDGVINERIVDGYVMDPTDLKLTPNLIQALRILSKKVNKIFVVSNQQCIGKGLCTSEEVDKVNECLNDQFLNEHILITDFLICPHKASDNCNCRKPKPGLAINAQKRYPSVNFKKALIIGDMISDLNFGKTLGMVTIYVGEKNVSNWDEILKKADFIYDNIYDFAKNIQ